MREITSANCTSFAGKSVASCWSGSNSPSLHLPPWCGRRTAAPVPRDADCDPREDDMSIARLSAARLSAARLSAARLSAARLSAALLGVMTLLATSALARDDGRYA